jgi:hypothetical protein
MEARGMTLSSGVCEQGTSLLASVQSKQIAGRFRRSLFGCGVRATHTWLDAAVQRLDAARAGRAGRLAEVEALVRSLTEEVAARQTELDQVVLEQWNLKAQADALSQLGQQRLKATQAACELTEAELVATLADRNLRLGRVRALLDQVIHGLDASLSGYTRRFAELAGEPLPMPAAEPDGAGSVPEQGRVQLRLDTAEARPQIGTGLRQVESQ